MTDARQLPSTTTVDFVALMASLIGETRTQLELLRKEMEEADNETQVISLYIDGSKSGTSQSFSFPTAGATYLPPGQWRSAYILWPNANYLRYIYDWGKYGTASGSLCDVVCVGSSGFTMQLQPNPTFVPLFGEQWLRLYQLFSVSPVDPEPVYAILSKRLYYNRFNYAGY